MSIKKINCETGGDRLDSCIAENFRYISRTFAQKLIRNGAIMVEGRKAKANLILKAGDVITLDLPEPVRDKAIPQKIHLEIIYEDKDIIVINKPKGIVVHPAAGNYSGTIVNALMEHCSDSLSDIGGTIRPGIVHRLDKDTTGVIVAAKNNEAHVKLSAQLKKHSMTRVYEAITDGVISENEGSINAPVGRDPRDRKKMAVTLKNSKNAVTHFKVLKRFPENTYVSLSLETGRTHQIRTHMAFIGRPLTGDSVYGRKNMQFDLSSQALHARILGFIHPSTGKYMEFEAPLPAYFSDMLEKLESLCYHYPQEPKTP